MILISVSSLSLGMVDAFMEASWVKKKMIKKGDT